MKIIIQLKLLKKKLIENIYINGNIKFKDEDLLNNLSSKQNHLFNKRFNSK